MIKNLILSILAIALAACGQKANTERTSWDVTYVDSSVGEPILLEKNDESFICPSLQTGDLSQEIVARVHNNWFSHQQNYVLAANNKSGLVVDSFYQSVTFAGDLKYLDSRVKGKLTYTEDVKPKDFRVCPGYNYYQESTYDSAVASAMFSFNKVKEALQSSRLKLAPVKIKIAPLVTLTREYFKNNKIVNDKKVLVNNAFYFADKKEIVFLPQGKNKNGDIPFSGVPLWEIPFVGAHEYGHHLFSSLMSNYQSDKKNLEGNKFSLCFDNHEKVTKDDNSKDGAPRRVTLSDVMDSINEGVADLFARVVIPKKYKLESIGCFEYTRDVEHSRFASGRPKRIDKKTLDIFLLNKRVKTANCYKEQDFQDPHIIGAIIANGMFKLYEQIGLSRKQRIEMITSWLKLSNNEYSSIKTKSIEGALSHMINNGVKVVHEKYDVPQAQLCRIIGQTFPMIHTNYSCR